MSEAAVAPMVPLGAIVSSLDQGWSPKCLDSASDSPDEWAVIKTTAIQTLAFDASQNKLLPQTLTPRPGLQIEAGDILITRAGPRSRVGIACVVPRCRPRLMLCDKAYRIRLHQDCADVRFVGFMLNSPAVLREIEALKSGINDSGLNLKQEQFLELKIPLPPPAEQRRIVAWIEALFARIRCARADLERITPLTRRYREQARKRAFGTEVQQPGSEEPIPLPDYAPPGRFEGLPELSEGWRWAEIASLGAVAGGITKNQQRAAQPIEIPYLRVANVYADELRLGSVETIRVSAAERERVMLEPGDLLVVEGNGSVEQIGRVAVWDGSVPGCGHQNHLIRVRPRPGVPPRYLLHWLMSPYGRSVLETIASSSSGLHTLSLSKVSAIPVPVPPPGTAAGIAGALDSAMAASGRTQAACSRALALLDHLEQAILAKAFRGELVPQDPNDEPATALLARCPQSSAPTRRRRAAAAPA